MNSFIDNLTVKNTVTDNGALSHSSSGSPILDQFGKAATYVKVRRDYSSKDNILAYGRPQSEVDADMALIWDENPELSMRMLFYWRMITRKNKSVYSDLEIQRGQGIRKEVFQRLLWVAKYHPQAFCNNLYLLTEVGSWKDLITLWEMDIEEVVKLESIFMLMTITIANADEEVPAHVFHLENIKKYIPTLRGKNKLKTAHLKKMRMFADGFMKFFDMTEREYREFKSSGISHKFQRDICQKKFDELNFAAIGGRVINNLVKKNKKGASFMERWSLEERYIKWLDSKDTINFVGYPYELSKKVNHSMSLIEEYTLNKQFERLLQNGRTEEGSIKGNIWCALDTSGSMNDEVSNGVTAYDVCISLGIYFSALNEGAFHNQVIMFDEKSSVMKLAGSFCEKVKQIQRASTAWGSTNFQSVIDEIVRVRLNNPNIPISDFPETLLVVSDMQFNPTKTNTNTNYEEAMVKLEEVGLPKINIVWWHVNGNSQDQPSLKDDKGTVLIGGFDGSIISTLLGGKNTTKLNEMTPMEAMLACLNQEILKEIEI